MDGPLSRKSAVCRLDRGLRATFSSRQNPLKPRGRASYCPVSRPLENRLFHVASAQEQTLALCLQIGRESNCRCHGMTSRRSFSSHVQGLPPPPGPDVPL